MWLDYFDKPYCSNSKAFFVSRIGYRLQELKYGGLKPETKNMLVKMFNSKEYRNPIFIKDERLPSVGTILVKIHNGVEHRVRIKGAAQIEQMDRSYMGKIIRLTCLAPDIVESILAGLQPRDLTLKDLICNTIPVDWNEQRKMFGFRQE